MQAQGSWLSYQDYDGNSWNAALSRVTSKINSRQHFVTDTHEAREPAYTRHATRQARRLTVFPVWPGSKGLTRWGGVTGARPAGSTGCAAKGSGATSGAAGSVRTTGLALLGAIGSLVARPRTAGATVRLSAMRPVSEACDAPVRAVASERGAVTRADATARGRPGGTVLPTREVLDDRGATVGARPDCEAPRGAVTWP